MLPNRCQHLNKFACNPYKHWVFGVHFITRTRKIKFSSIQFCIGYLVLFDFICFQLSCFHGLFLIVLSICYHRIVIIYHDTLYFCSSIYAETVTINSSKKAATIVSFRLISDILSSLTASTNDTEP